MKQTEVITLMAMRCRYCPYCDTERNTEVIKRKETYPVRGDNIAVDAHIAVCTSCGEEILDENLDSMNLLNAYDIYRAKHGILTPEDIVQLRKEYSLSQRALARLLGWGEATISRYETGALPDTAHNLVLKSLRNPRVMRCYVGENPGALTPTESDRLERRLREVQDQSFLEELHDLLETIVSQSPSVLNGFRVFDIDRLAHMTIYFAGGMKLWKTMLMKLLFYSDFNHFNKYALSISGAVYARLPQGPALDKYLYILGLMEDEGYIEIREEPIGRFEGEVIYALIEFNRSLFSQDELQTLEAIKKRLDGKTSQELSHISHQEPAWKELLNGQQIPYTYAARLIMQI